MIKANSGRAGIPTVTLVFTDGVPNYNPYKPTECLPTPTEANQVSLAAATLRGASSVIAIGVGMRFSSETDKHSCSLGALCALV
jgi:hypothetical protein